VKKIYETPELEILCFAPCERLALDGRTFQQMYGGFEGGADDGVDSFVEVTVTNPEEW